MRRRRLLEKARKPVRKEMLRAVNRTIGETTRLVYQMGYDHFFHDAWAQLSRELMQIIDAYADTVAEDSIAWRTGKPTDQGYYLGAWQSGRHWNVSELWYNPGTQGSGWWKSRMYLEQRDYTYTTVDVVAWMPMPQYRPRKQKENQ
jgi:hypothetical protein